MQKKLNKTNNRAAAWSSSIFETIFWLPHIRIWAFYHFVLHVLPRGRWWGRRAPPSCRRAAASPAPGRTWWWAKWRREFFQNRWRRCQSCPGLKDWTHTAVLLYTAKHFTSPLFQFIFGFSLVLLFFALYMIVLKSTRSFNLSALSLTNTRFFLIVCR